MSDTDSLNLFIEINISEFIFIIVEGSEDQAFKIIHKDSIQTKGISNDRITDLNLMFETLKKKIYLIEQKFNIIFSEVILVIDTFNCKTINFSGYMKLNGSQLTKENITYILNSLKSKINEIEKEKTIMHIFNCKYLLDKKEVENLPIGLFGNFYSHELSFFLINNNDFKNLENVFNRCNLKVKKIISKSFIEGANIIKNKNNLDSFLKIEIKKKNTKIVVFENSSLKFIQNFKFGSDIIINDISKVTGIKSEKISEILINSDFDKKDLKDELVEKKFFSQDNYRKIRKKLLIEIANARIQEMSEIILFKNINILGVLKKNIKILLNLSEKSYVKSLRNSYKILFSKNNYCDLEFLNNNLDDGLYSNANRIVQYGWKKEAVPVVQEKKTIISRFFDYLFK